MWAGLLPSGTFLCADSFFGSHELACDLAAERHAFLMMTKRSTYGVVRAGELLAAGQTATCTVHDARYAMVVFKNPKMGHKPPRVLPMLTAEPTELVVFMRLAAPFWSGHHGRSGQWDVGRQHIFRYILSLRRLAAPWLYLMYGLAFGSISFIEMLFIAFSYCCILNDV